MKTFKKITSKDIEALQPGQEIRDPILKGFGARRRSKVVSYFVHTEILRRQRWITIGTHGNPWTLEKARERATHILYAAKQGIDLIAREKGDCSRVTFEDVFNRIIDDRAPHLKPATIREYRRLARRTLIPFFKKKPFNQITRDDIVSLHKALVLTPSLANHAIAFTKVVFNWAETCGQSEPVKNPCLRIKFYKTRSRVQFLTLDDLARLAQSFRTALETGIASPVQVSAILMLLLTGARRSEIFTLKRSYVDRHRMLAHLPDSKTGSKVLQLNAHALAVLDSIPEIPNNPYYFVGRFSGTCITEIRKPWDAIRKMAKLEDFRLHDFRHSFASFAADTGATSKTVGALLGHASIETTKLYIHLFNGRASDTASRTAAAVYAGLRTSPPQSKTHANPPPQEVTQLEPWFPAHCA